MTKQKISRFGVLLFCVLSLSGCIRQTINKAPALSGTVIDSNRGEPLAGVVVYDHFLTAVDDHFLTAADGRFEIPAIIDRIIWSSPLIFGAGSSIGRAVSFHKEGYQETICLNTSLSMMNTKNKVTIPLLKIEESEAVVEPPIFLPMEDAWVTCQAFIGSWVEYQNNNYRIRAIHQEEQDGYTQSSITLWPVGPNGGDLISNVNANDLQLISMPNITELSVKAKQGDAQSQLDLGLYYANGIGVKQDYDQAFDWVHKAAEKNLVTAQLELAKFYATGTGTEKNIDETMNWLNKAAKKGLRDAQIALGKQYSSRKKSVQDYSAAHFWFEKAADQNSTEAMELLAIMYVRGQGVDKDYRQSAQWLQHAINAGSIRASYNLAFYFINGTGVTQDSCKGENLLKQAAKQGHGPSISYFIDKAARQP